MSEKYLYGAAVQGIQSFIFQTNKLREIVGASELVEEICTSKFAQLLGFRGYYNDLKKKLKSDNNCILHAAGNVKYIFEDKTACEKIVREFPKEISIFAPGITVSQAVVKMDGKYSKFKDAVNELEHRLRIQRNRQMRSVTLGMMGIERSHQTGMPVIYKDGSDIFDAATFRKLQYEWERHNGEKRIARRHTTQNLCNKAFLPLDSVDSIPEHMIAFDTEDMTKSNDWIAIIHADGNGLGQIVQKIGIDEKEFKKFSNLLDKATIEAAYKAYKWLIDNKRIVLGEGDRIPIRPIVLGGDDFTVICRADIALDYVTKFIDEFQKGTKEHLSSIINSHNVFIEGGTKGLTACAGIAYIKSSYPFYYGYELAEALCSRAKKDAKNKDTIREGKELPMSCLMFHKVQDSFTESWDEIAKRELTPQNNISFEFGPYYLEAKDKRWTINDLKNKVKEFSDKEGNAVKSHLRNWMSLLHDNPDMAVQKLSRLKSMLPNTPRGRELLRLINEVTDEKNEKGETIVYPVYDMLTLHTINTQKTKEDK